MLGAIIGDTVGSVYEFLNIKTTESPPLWISWMKGCVIILCSSENKRIFATEYNMDSTVHKKLITTLEEYHSLGIDEQVNHSKFYLYSLITHSTAIEGSTVTEIENQLLLDEGITSSKRS